MQRYWSTSKKFLGKGISVIWATCPEHILRRSHQFWIQYLKNITKPKLKTKKTTTTKQPKANTQVITCWAAEVSCTPLKSKPSEKSCQMTETQRPHHKCLLLASKAWKPAYQLFCTYCCKAQVPTQPWGFPKPRKGKPSRPMKSHIQLLRKSADK